MKRKKDTAKARDEQRLREENSRKPKQQKKRKKRSVPKTVQKTLPYQMIVYDCIFRIDDSHFSKTSAGYNKGLLRRRIAADNEIRLYPVIL